MGIQARQEEFSEISVVRVGPALKSGAGHRVGSPVSGGSSHRSRVGVEGPLVPLSRAANLFMVQEAAGGMQGWGGAGEQPAGPRVQPSSSAASHDGRGTVAAAPRPLPGHLQGPVASTAQLCPSPGEKWWAVSCVKHSPLREPETPTGIRRLKSPLSLESHWPSRGPLPLS